MLLLLVRLRQPRRGQVQRRWLLSSLLGQGFGVPLQRERAEPLLLLRRGLRPFGQLELLPNRRWYSSGGVQRKALVKGHEGPR